VPAASALGALFVACSDKRSYRYRHPVRPRRAAASPTPEVAIRLLGRVDKLRLGGVATGRRQKGVMTTNPLDVSCPNCGALPGKRCIELRTRHRKRLLTRREPHVSRWWPTRPCPRCPALPGEQCRTPSGRIQRTPHTSRCALSREEQRRLEQQRSPPMTAARPPRAHAAASPPPDRAALLPLPPVQPAPPRTGVQTATQLATAPLASDHDQPSAAAGHSDAPDAGIRPGHGPVAGDVAARPAGEQVATNTLRAYTSDWRRFERWTDERALRALPADPGTCAAYLSDLTEQGLHVNTVRRRAHVIAQTHQRAGEANPISDPRVQRALELAAQAPRAPTDQKLPLVRAVLARVIDHIDTTSSSGLRDRALLLTGAALGLRRAELAAITLADLHGVCLAAEQKCRVSVSGSLARGCR
jgi:hypothetical protein